MTTYRCAIDGLLPSEVCEYYRVDSRTCGAPDPDHCQDSLHDEDWRQREGAAEVNNPSCPTCGNRLHRVTQSPNSMLNADQFDAVRAGDWYCENCPSNGRGRSGFAYFWNREVAETEPPR